MTDNSLKSLSVPELGNPVCPGCGQTGQRVAAVTVESLVTGEARARLPRADGFRFCATPECAVVYYHPTTGDRVNTEALRGPVFQKSRDPTRLVCHCFGHAVAAIEADARATGGPTIPASIQAKCGQGLDDCARTNPQGRCCLGNVRRVARAARASAAPLQAPGGSDEAENGAEGGCGCCGGGKPS